MPTNVLYYINKNNYPILIRISSRNYSVTVPPGHRILNNEGKNVNDPVLEECCNKFMLSKVTTNGEPVDIVFVPGFRGEEPKPKEVIVPVQNNNFMHVYSREDALKRGVIPKIREEYDRDEVVDTGKDDLAISHRNIPEKKKVDSTPKVLPSPPSPPDKMRVKSSKPITESEKDGVYVMSKEEAVKSGLLKELVEIPEDYGIDEGTEATADDIPLLEPALYSIRAKNKVRRVIETEPIDDDIDDFIVDESKKISVEDLPDPTLDKKQTIPLLAKEKVRKNNIQRFKCLVPGCEKTYDFRSYLLNHVRQKHPDLESDIMRNYPGK